MKKANKDNKCNLCVSNRINGGSCKGMPPHLPSCGGLKIKGKVGN